MLLQLLVVLVELSEFIWQDVSVGNEIKVLLPISLLHPDHIKAEPILPRNLVALWEMVDFLILVQSFVQIALAA